MLRLATHVTTSPTRVAAELVGDLGDRLATSGPRAANSADDLVLADLVTGADAVEDLDGPDRPTARHRHAASGGARRHRSTTASTAHRRG